MLTKEQTEKLHVLLNNMSDDNNDVRTTYSGRGMYGRTCLAFTGGGKNDVLALMINSLIDDLMDVCMDGDEAEAEGARGETQLFVSELMNYRTDSLGTGSVIYWPNISFDRVDDAAKPTDN